MRPVLVIDTETTSLVPDYDSGTGTIWEVAFIERAAGAEHLWLMKADELPASPEALAVGRYEERTAGTFHATAAEIREHAADVWDLAGTRGHGRHWSDPAALAEVLAGLLRDATLIAANPAFDAGFMSAFLARYGQPPRPWHYRLRDIGSMAYGYLCGRATEPPATDASTDVMAEALGIDVNGFARHSALGDCRLVAAMLDVIEGGRL